MANSVILLFLVTSFLGSETSRIKAEGAFSCDPIPPPAVFVFGDSLSDTGNYMEAFPFYADDEDSPYGSIFFHAPSGRFSDGRLIIDFMASKWGFPFVDPYFNNIVPNYKHGIDFAVAGATAGNIAGPVPFFLSLQTYHFGRFKRRVYASLNSEHKSDCLVSHLPTIEAFKDGIYMIFIGINDIAVSLFGDNSTTPSDVKEKTVPSVVSAISKAVQDLYKEGAKNFMVFNILAIGCTPSRLVRGSQGPFNSTDSLGCLQEYNDVVDFANLELEKSLCNIAKQFKDVSIVVVDLYKFMLDAVANPTSNGFKESEKFKACCGYGGGPYNYSPLVFCGQNPAAKACSNPREYMSWDGIHLTDSFSQQFVEEMMEGMHYLKPVSEF
ncbi:hypothetical protein HHK36_024487 [Tetracentron sinense]|uniref:Uncharacterized protein n=1 Tax=Tetracentron sinense TaxID=13715 RepID=A0A834YKD4_TETSI|nr:hypothetical protein HHK36_024487 [Tetracentron sinense]